MQSPHWRRGGTALWEHFVQLRALLLVRLFVDGPSEILVDGPHQRIEPAPVRCDRLENNLIAVPANPNLIALKAKFLRQPDRLGSPGPKEFGCLHCPSPCCI